MIRFLFFSSVSEKDLIKLDIYNTDPKKIGGKVYFINDDFAEQAEISKKILEKAGLHLLDKRHSEMVKDSEFGFQNTYNQIWARLPVKK